MGRRVVLWSDRPGMKFCTQCGAEKAVANFTISRIRRDGSAARRGQCKVCIEALARPRAKILRDKRRLARLAAPKPQKLKLCPECAINKPAEEFLIIRRGSGCLGRRKLCVLCHQSGIDIRKAERKAARDAIQASAVKRCKTCGETKPIGEFHKHTSRGHCYYYECKLCHNVLQRAWGRKWTASNPTGQRAKERRRRAAKRGAEGTHTSEDIARIRKAQKDRCCFPWCRVKLHGKGHIEHRVALAAGGSDDAKNLQLSCLHCNSSKGVRDEVDFVRSRGLLI